MNGTGIVLNKKWRNLVENTIHNSDRITAIKIKKAPVNTVIVQVYMPTSSHSNDKIEDNNLDTIIYAIKEKII